MKRAYLFPDKDWYCPHCGEINNTGVPKDTVQCSWCLKESKNINFPMEEIKN